MEHPEHYTASESVRRAALLIRGGRRVLKGKSTAAIDKRLEALADEAREREAAAKKK